MANIGTFTADKDGYTGTLRTLTLNVKVKLVPNDRGDNEKAPDFRVQAASHDIGAAWKKTSEAGRDYPVFSMVSLHTAIKGRPKNLIFASPDKPDLRFRDVLDNDVEIVTNADKVLVYDRPIDALLRFRMDFLLLLPQGVRVVIEVDGKHHYADGAGSADVQRYAQMVRGDRELKLAGYEVFRFGAMELQAPAAKADVKAFFETLFKRYGVPTS